MRNISLFVILAALLSSPIAWAQDLGKPIGWASCNGGTTGSGITDPAQVTEATPNVFYPTTEAEFQNALNSAKKAEATTIIIRKDTKISFSTGTKVDTGAKNISILGEPGVEFNCPGSAGGILNVRGKNVIIRNIVFTGPGAIDVDGNDPLGIEGGTNVWVDHCTFSDGIDGNLDIKSQANYVTVSWCKFYYTAKSKNHEFSNLVGHSDNTGATDAPTLKITYAMNWWGDNVKERMPRVRFGSVHCVNNLYRSPGNNYCIRAGKEANICADNNAFVGVKDPVTNNETDLCHVTMSEADNYYKDCTGNLSAAGLKYNDAALFNPYNEYEYTPVPKDKLETILMNTGIVDGFTQTTGAGATLWQNIQPGEGEGDDHQGGGEVAKKGSSIFGPEAPTGDFFWFSEANAATLDALRDAGTLSGTAAHNKTKNDASYTDKVGALVVPATNGTLVFKLASCSVFKLYMVRTGSYAGNVYTSTDGTTWGEPVVAITGNKGVQELDCSAFAAGRSEIYVKIENTSNGGLNIYGADICLAAEEDEEEEPFDRLTDVWDFGAEPLDVTLYNNMLTNDIINSCYPTSVTPGTNGVNFAETFTAGSLTWKGGSNDRLRTSNTALTRFDENVGDKVFTGRLYVNASAIPERCMTLTLNEDDEVSVFAASQNGKGLLHFINTADGLQDNTATLGTTAGEVKFVASRKDSYRIYDSEDKPSYYRITRKSATYVTVSGSVSTPVTGDIPANYSIVLTNEAGKDWKTNVVKGVYSVKVPAGYSYTLSLKDANGYIISSESTLAVVEATVQDIVIERIALFTVNGTIKGLGEGHLAKLILHYAPASQRIYVPQPKINIDGTYSVELEPNCEYAISASGVNDYRITSDKITVTEATATDITFEAKPRHAVTITATGLSAEQQAAMQLTFTNLKEKEYSYSFLSLADVKLRDGIYSIACEGMDAYPLQPGLTSNLKVDGTGASKELAFKAVSQWPFNDKEIKNGATAYNGLLFTGSVKNELAKGHLLATEGATVQIPVKAGEKIIATFYYSANFSINGGENITTTTSTGSTGKTDIAEYTYTGAEPGYVTLRFGTGTTYLTNLAAVKTMAYAAELQVGKEQTYKTINEALDAVRSMARPASERVTILIEPGNYEEMLVVDMPNVSLVNAAVAPSIALQNKGVDIDGQAVRITSYYGHGYSYYSMGNDQKWNPDVQRVNKENGYLSYTNTGSGTTNNSYWNATVVVTANGFEAKDIIFENSFNQYISKKETEDTVVEWVTGGKGQRPTDYKSTDVQNKNFVERAAALALANGVDKTILNNCRIIGRQDSFFGGANVRAAIYKGAVMGACDYIFGGMTAVFYQTELAMNTSEDKNDVAYITAPQQSAGRGYLMYECVVTSAQPETETSSNSLSKPGYFGRPWQANTSEVVFYKTTLEKSNFPGFEDKSLITPEGWNNSLGGTSNFCYEYATTEKSGEDNATSRASWANLLSTPQLKDGTTITPFNFTKGTDNWDPIKALIDKETGISTLAQENWNIVITTNGSEISIEGIDSDATVHVYSVNGALERTFRTNTATRFTPGEGAWIIRVATDKGNRIGKAVTTQP